MVWARRGSSAYASLLVWALDTATSVTIDADLPIAEYLEFNPVADSAALRMFDDALANHGFEINGDSITGHSVSVLGPGNYGRTVYANRIRRGQAVPRQPAAQDSVAGSVPGVKIIFVNGIENFNADVLTTQRRLNTLVRASTQFPHATVASFWNRNLRTTANGFSDSTTKCVGLADRDARFRQSLVVLWRYSRCAVLNHDVILVAGDLLRSGSQFIGTQFGLGIDGDADVDSLAQFISYYHSQLQHTIVVAHSQGNMVFAAALPHVQTYDGSALQVPMCTAILSLAAPIHLSGFGPLIDGTHLRGMTINGDLLLWSGLPNDFTPYKDSDISLLAPAAIARAKPYLQ